MDNPAMSPERSWHTAEIELLAPEAAALLIKRHVCGQDTK
jgi:hypothetical protein